MSLLSNFHDMPWQKRFMIAGPIALVAAWIAARLSASIWSDEMVEATSEMFDASYESTFFEFDGDFGMRGVVIDYPTSRGEVHALQADKATVDTPGVFWFARNAFFKESKTMPDTGGIRLENVRYDTETDQTPGNYTNLPYDAMGCKEDLLTPAEVKAMGFPQLRQDIALDMRREAGDTIVAYTSEAPGLGRLRIDLKVDVSGDIARSEFMTRMMSARILSAKLTMEDLGYVGKRNEYCAGKRGLSVPDFIEHHMREVDRRLARQGLVADAGTRSRYRDFAEKGGMLVLESRGAPSSLTIGQFLTLDHDDKLEMFSGTIAANEVSAVPFVLTKGAATPAATEKSLAPTSTAPDIAATMIAPPPDLRPGAELTYDQLAPVQGQRVEVTTLAGSVRLGELRVYSPYMLTLVLDADEGGIKLNIPKGDIEKIRFMPAKQTPASATVESANAKTQ